MFETLFYDEEGLLILNLEEIRADFLSGQYHRDPYGKVFVTCPSGHYPLFAYLSRIAGMKGAREALEKFRAEKLSALDRECYTTKKLKDQQELEDLLRRSFYYYHYADADMIQSTDDFLSAFQDAVYDGQYDYEAFCEGVREDVHENAEEWQTEQKAFVRAIERMERRERCDAAEAARRAIKSSAIASGVSDLNQADLAKAIFEHATGEYCIACLDIVNERYAIPASTTSGDINREYTYVSPKFHRDDWRSVFSFVQNEADMVQMVSDSIEQQVLKVAQQQMYNNRRYLKEEEYVKVRDLNTNTRDLEF